MNPRRFRYCLLAAALAVALWRLPAASSSTGWFAPGSTSAEPVSTGPSSSGAAQGSDPAQAPPALVIETAPASMPNPR